MNRPLRAAVVGAAPYGFGARAHIPGALAAEGVELLAVCTSRDETAREAARRWGAPRWYGGIDRLLEDGEVDLVTIAVKPRSHHPLVRAALEAGKMVYCEWPLALDSEEAADLASLAEERSLPTGVGLQGRWAPVLRCMRELVAEGFTGAPLSFDAVQKLPRFEVASDRSWLARETEASGALFVAAAHVVDAVRFVLSEPEAAAGVRATLLADDRFSDTGAPFRWEASDTVNCLLRLQGGEIGTLSVSNITDPPAGFMLRVAGDRGGAGCPRPRLLPVHPAHPGGGQEGGTPGEDRPAAPVRVRRRSGRGGRRRQRRPGAVGLCRRGGGRGAVRTGLPPGPRAAPGDRRRNRVVRLGFLEGGAAAGARRVSRVPRLVKAFSEAGPAGGSAAVLSVRRNHPAAAGQLLTASA